MKIAIATETFRPHTGGGIDRMCDHYLRGLSDCGHRVQLICARRDSSPSALSSRVECYEADSRNACTYHTVNIGRTYRALRDLTARFEPDVLFTHHPHPALTASLPPLSRLPHVHCFHSSMALEWASEQNIRKSSAEKAGPFKKLVTPYLLKILERAAFSSADRIVALSRYSAGLLEREFNVPPQIIHCLPGTVDTAKFAPDHSSRTGQPFRMLTIRRLEPRMGLANLIRAAGILRAGNCDFRLEIGGTGSLEDELKDMIRTMDLHAEVRMSGHIPEAELVGRYRSADLFVLPTIAFEGFGLVTLEALACGTPVLATRVGASPEILGDLDDGLLCPPTPEGLAERISYWMSHRPHLQKLATVSPQYVRTHYGRNQMIRKLEKVFQRALCR